MPVFGELDIIPNTELDVEWKIDGFLTLMKLGGEYWSPGFHFEGHLFCLVIYLNKCEWEGSVVCIDLYLNRLSPGLPSRIPVDFSISLKTVDGLKDQERHCTEVFELFISDLHGFSEFMSGSELRRRQSELVPSGIFTVACTLKKLTNAESAEKVDSAHHLQAESDESCDYNNYDESCNYDASSDFNDCDESCESETMELGDTARANCCHCKKSFDAERILSHEKKCMEKPVKCPDCLEIILLANWLYDHECQGERTQGNESLCHDFKKVLLDGLNHDLILKVGDAELKAHQDILRARSLVFKSMLNDDAMKKTGGVIDIPDCDPQAMKQFLTYIYSGTVDTIDQSTMLKLYYIANKYDVTGLKEECVKFIKNLMSDTNFIEVIQFALNHGDSSLQECATEHFMEYPLHIIGTAEWQSFFKDNFKVASELLNKFLKSKKENKLKS